MGRSKEVELEGFSGLMVHLKQEGNIWEDHQDQLKTKKIVVGMKGGNGRDGGCDLVEARCRVV